MLVPSTVELLDATPATLRATLADVPDHCIDMPGAEGWSARDVVVHLASRQRPAFIGRVRAIIEHEGAVLPDIPDEKVAEEFTEMTLAALLDDLAVSRREAMAFVRSLTAEELARTGRHETAGDVSAADIVHHILYHDLIHIAQINDILRTPIERARGAMRIFT